MINSVPRWCIWITLAILACVGFMHLTADFPNYSRWLGDTAKCGDEGWWASGAINHVLTGHWLRPGDYNPILAVPFWSALMGLFFHFTGISIVIARGTAFTFTIGTALAAGGLMVRNHRSLAPFPYAADRN